MDKLIITIPITTSMDDGQLLDIMQHWCTTVVEDLQTYEEEAIIDEEEVVVNTASAPALAAAAPELLAACQDLWNAIVKDAFLLTPKQCEKIRESGTTQAAIDRAIAAIAVAQGENQ